ncbi:MAG: DNA double-strand break repair nuclease NurA [Nanoarchaeota archaeon]|nr:DNA double-strand break repair nuclease NurA [Nanoarchaeota archaeon]
MQKILDKVADELKSITSRESKRIVFTNPDYTAVDFSTDNFHQIPKNLDTDGHKVVFIDGGNATLVESASFIASFVRLCACVYQGNKRLSMQKHEFFVIVSSVSGDDKIKYKTNIYPVNDASVPSVSDLKFDSMDESLRNGVSRAEIGRVVDCARRFAELNLAAKIAYGLGEGDIIILDGTLEAKYTHEEKYLNLLYKIALSKDLKVCAVAKTCRFVTDSGDNALVAVNRMTKLPAWYYFPIVRIQSENHRAHLFFTKLHEKAEYLFRFELHSGVELDGLDLRDLFYHIAENSKDSVYLGYPYGLVEADKHARVTNNEKNYLRTLLASKINLEKYAKTLDAHSVLDNIG